MEGKKREVDRLAAEMEVAKDGNRDSERRLAMQKDSVRAAERELERMRDSVREYEMSKGASDEQMGAANVALKGTVAAKDETIRKLERRLQWTEEENATKVSLLNKEKEGLLLELGLQSSPSPGRKQERQEGGGGSPKHVDQAHKSHTKKKEQMERRASGGAGKEKKKATSSLSSPQGAVPNWNGFKDDLAETANWPPSGGNAVQAGGRVSGTDSNGRYEEPTDEAVDGSGRRWDTANPTSATGNFYKEEEGSAGSVINRAADFLAKRRQKGLEFEGEVARDCACPETCG